MNRFRANLHPAFFKNPEVGQDSVENPLEAVAKELTDLQSPLYNEFKDATNQFLSDVNGDKEQKIKSRYTDPEKLKSDHARFARRLNSKVGDKTYSEILNNKITEGWGRLLNALRSKKYFEGKKDAKAEIAKIKDKYWNEVKKQYINNVWFADDNKFEATKNMLFDYNEQTMQYYPANKIYCELTGAKTILKVDRTYTEGYGSDIILNNQENRGEVKEDNTETSNDKQNRKFLSNDLTQYLWDIRKAPGVAFDVVQGLIPVFSAKIDRPSKEDRQAISNFLKTSTKIEVSGKDPAIALLEVFHDNRLNTDSTPEDYKAILNDHGINLKKDKYLNDVVEAGNFYISTQTTTDNVRDQHAIYLSVLKIVEMEGGANGATNKFKSIVEQSKKENKKEKKDGYKKGEVLEKTEDGKKLKDLATKLGVLDFTNASRLNALDKEYFSTTSVENILANLNNDKTIDARDSMAGGLKTGPQFLAILKQVGKETALNNLLTQAKLVNKSLNLELDESKFTEQGIKSGDKELILLLQDIISKPGEDLYTLLSGNNKENPFEGVDLKAAKEGAEEKAKEIISKLDREALEKDGLTLPTPESMQSGLAATLYSEYTRGIGLGSKISFDEWINGLEMSTGFQVRKGGEVVVGIGLDYRNKINLGKGWSTSPELSAGAFIPIGYGKPEVTPSVGLNNEVAKEWITNKGIKQHLGLQGGVTLMPHGVVVLSGGLNWSQDKLGGIEVREQEMKGELQKEMKDVLDKVYEARKKIKSPNATKLDFSDQALIDTVKSELKKTAEKLGVKEKDQELVVNATMRLLVNYNSRDLHEAEVRDLIAQGVSEQYAMSWAEARKAKITDKVYLSGANLGVFWVVGAPMVGVYAGLRVTKHRLDGYGDKWGNLHEINHEKDVGQRDAEKLSAFNQELGLSGNDAIKLNDQGMVVIPSSIKHRVVVNRKLKGLMKKGDNGEIILDPNTPMAADIKKGSATQGSEIVIGGNQGQYLQTEGDTDFVKLDTIDTPLEEDRWFTKANIDQGKILELGDGVKEYSVDIVNQAINELNKKLSGNPLGSFDFNNYPKKDGLITKLNALDKTKKAKLVINNDNGTITIEDPKQGSDGRGLEIEYKSNFEMIDKNAKDVADAVYAEALKVKDPRALHAVKHAPWPEYNAFMNGMFFSEEVGNYDEARKAIKPIFEKLDKQIAGAKFTEIGNKLDNIKDNVALGQALMSINNVFARSKKVRGGGENYEFKGWINGREKPVSMGSIIKERERQIKGTIQEKITDESVKQGYVSLIDASARYREENPDLFRKTSDKAKQLDNTIGFNLGDKTNPENPLFNPEIYSSVVNLNSLESFGFTKENKDALHKRTMELLAGNETLISPFLKALGLEGKTVKIVDFKSEGEKGKLSLDIGGGNDIKRVVLSAGMEFGYFTQCVNHTVILNDISAETEDGTSVTFNSGVWQNGRYIEGSKTSIVSTTEVGASVAVTVNTPDSKVTTTPQEEEEDYNPADPNANTDPGQTGTPNGDKGGNPPETGGNGNGNTQTGGRESDSGSDSGGDNSPKTGGDGNSGHQGGGGPAW